MAKSELEIIISATDKASDEIKGVSTGLQKLGTLAKGLAVAGIGAATAAAGAALVGLGAGLKVAIDEAMEAQEVMAQLDAVIASTGGSAGLTADEVSKIADSLSAVTRFEDETILAGQTILLQFTKIGEDIFPRASEAMLDLSTRLGVDIPNAAKLVGRALEGNFDLLTRYGITFDEATKKTIEGLIEAGKTAEAQEIIFQQLEKSFGGAARAAGDTFAGQLDIVKNQLLNVAESAGTVLLPALSDLLTTVTPYVVEFANAFATFVQSDQFKQWLADTVAWLKNDLIPGIRDAANWFRNDFIPVVKAIWAVAGPVLKFLGAAFKFLWSVEIAAFVTFIGNQIDAIKGFFELFNRGKEIVSNLADSVRNSIGILTTAIKDMLRRAAEAILKARWLELGKAIVQGIAKGIGQFAGILIAAAKALALKALNAIKAALGIKSPSKVFAEEVGANIGLGIIDGMRATLLTGLNSEFVKLNLSPELALQGARPGVMRAGRASSSNVVVNYSSLMSLSDRESLESILLPIIQRAIRRYG